MECCDYTLSKIPGISISIRDAWKFHGQSKSDSPWLILVDTKWFNGDHRCSRTPKQMAVILGTIQTTAFISPLGMHLMICLQHLVNRRLIKDNEHGNRRWWATRQYHALNTVMDSLRILRPSTLDTNPLHPTWNRKIGLVISPQSYVNRKIGCILPQNRRL